MTIIQYLHFNQVHIALILTYIDLLIFALRTRFVVKQDIRILALETL